MLIPVTVMSLPWVTLGQVSKTLLINKTHLTHEQLEATRWLFCQFDHREDRHPLPLKLQGGKVVGHTVPDAQGNPGTSTGPWASSGGPRRPCGAAPGSPARPCRLPVAAAANPRKQRHSTGEVGSYLQTWETRVLGSSGSSGGLWAGIPSLRLPPLSPPHPRSCFRPRLWATASVYIRCLCVDSTCIT